MIRSLLQSIVHNFFALDSIVQSFSLKLNKKDGEIRLIRLRFHYLFALWWLSIEWFSVFAWGAQTYLRFGEFRWKSFHSVLNENPPFYSSSTFHTGGESLNIPIVAPFRSTRFYSFRAIRCANGEGDKTPIAIDVCKLKCLLFSVLALN